MSGNTRIRCEPPLNWVKRQCLCLWIWVFQFRTPTRFFQQRPLKSQQRKTVSHVSLQISQVFKSGRVQPWMWVCNWQHSPNHVSYIPSRSVRLKIVAKLWKCFPNIPLRQCRKLGFPFQNKSNFSPRQHIKTSGEFSFITLRSLSQAANNSIIFCKQHRGLACFRPVPVTYTQGIINKY